MTDPSLRVAPGLPAHPEQTPFQFTGCTHSLTCAGSGGGLLYLFNQSKLSANDQRSAGSTDREALDKADF